MGSRLGTFLRRSAIPFRMRSSLAPRPIQQRRKQRSVPRGRRLHHNQILSRHPRPQSNNQQTSTRRSLPLSLCSGLQLSLRKKQKEICRTEFRYQVIKEWSPVLIHLREIISTSAPFRLDPL